MKLSALRPNNPVAMMAAYGALRLLPRARLRWTGPHPELIFEGDIFEHLAEQLPQRLHAPEIALLDDVGECPDLIGRIPDHWLIAYAGQCSPRQMTGTGRKVRMLPRGWTPTDLLLMGGRHQFVANAREIMTALTAHDVRAKLEEALIGPWRYEDLGLQAWGWDAAARIDASSSPKAVTATQKYGVLAAYWLAWESLPLWPMINGRTVGMGRSSWVYPTCAEWLGIEGLGALILGLNRMSLREITGLGVTRWCAERIGSSDYGNVLGWAIPLSARTSIASRKPERFARVKKSSELMT